MRRLGPAALLVLALVIRGALAAPSGPGIVDDRGRAVRLKAPAERIIPLYGAYTEILLALGLKDRIVACTKADRGMPELQGLPRIGTHMRPNVELVFTLHPDLVIQGGGRSGALQPVARLESLGIPVAVFDPVDFGGLFSTIRRIARLAGVEERGGALTARLRARLEALKDPPFPRRPKVFFEVRYPNLLAAGGRSMANAVIRAAGGTNCFGRTPRRFVRPGLEAVIQCDPDLYVVQVGPMNRDPSPPSKRPGFGLLRAVREGRVLYVEEARFSRPGPRAVDAAEELHRAIEALEGGMR